MNGLIRLFVAVTGVDVIAARLFPSAPAHVQGRLWPPLPTPQTPAPKEEGEASAGAGQTPEGGVAPATEPTPSERVDAVEHATPRPPVPRVETVLTWSAHPHHFWELTDEHLAQLLDHWQESAR